MNERREHPGTKGLRRFCPLHEVRVDGADGGKPVLVGHAAVFDSESDAGGRAWFREVIRPGAFRKTVGEADVRALINHEPSMLLGRTRSKTLRITEDDVGLSIEVDLPDTSYARDLMVTMQRSDIDQMSFAFDVVKERWSKGPDEQKELRELIELSLNDGDVSIVTFPWYGETDAELDMRAEMRALITKAKRGMLSDADKALLQELLEELRSITTPEPGKDSHSDAPGADEPPKAGHSAELAIVEVQERMNRQRKLMSPARA